MIEDLRTVAWKEWRSLVGGRVRRQVLLTGGMISIYAVLFPIQVGPDWASDPVLMGVLGIVLPMVIVGLVVPDAIAGERERHTLATLLASRLPDRAILYGKLGFAIVLGWVSAPLVLTVALLVVNIAFRDAGARFYDPGLLAAVLALSLLVALLTGGVAIFVSLRARTAQEAQQLTVVGLMTPFLLVGFGLTFLFADRERARSLVDWLGSIDVRSLVLGVMAVIALIDALILWAADRRFRRGRLAGR